MTAKEKQRMQRLEAENRELREMHDKHFEAYRDCLIEIVELRAKLALVESALMGGE